MKGKVLKMLVKKKPRKIEDFFDHATWNAYNFNFSYDSHLYKDDEDDPIAFDVMDKDILLETIIWNYQERYILMPEINAADDAYRTGLFCNLIQDWFDEMGSNLADGFGALFYEYYDPLENYNGEEDHEVTREFKHGETITDTLTHTADKETDSLDYYGVDGTATPANNNKLTKEYSGQRQNVSAHTGTDTDKTIKDHLHRHGNLGVTTSQQMIQSSLELAFLNWYDKVIKAFMDDRTFYM